MKRSVPVITAILGALAVALGAFAAHGLKGKLEAHSLSVFETAVRYHFIHVIVLLIIAFSYKTDKNLFLAERFLLAGIVLFSGSLYLLSTAVLWTSASVNWLGPITPIGGLCFIIGWFLLARYFVKVQS